MKYLFENDRGQQFTVSELSKKNGIPVATIHERLRKGVPPPVAVAVKRLKMGRKRKYPAAFNEYHKILDRRMRKGDQRVKICRQCGLPFQDNSLEKVSCQSCGGKTEVQFI